MKQLVCEMCGGTDLIKQDGVFVCQSCGTKYSVEEAKKMMVEGTVDVTGSTVKVDTSDELANLYQIARRAKDNNDSGNAAKYYDMILIKDPDSWEAAFYAAYFKAMECKIDYIESAANSVSSCFKTVLTLIKSNVTTKEDQIAAVKEIIDRSSAISMMLHEGARNYYKGLGKHISEENLSKANSSCRTALGITYLLGDDIDSVLGDDEIFHELAAMAWKIGVSTNTAIANSNNGFSCFIDFNRIEKIQKYEPAYQAPEVIKSSTGCYIATAIYGSYDCPQVWVLRRFRDDTLAGTWYGRFFIHCYYSVSPILVSWFGKKEWFKKPWHRLLNRMVAKLKSKGVMDTPYEDRGW